MTDKPKDIQPENQNPEEELEEDAQFDSTPKQTDYGLIKPVKITQEMEKSYLDYAMSVIVSRALPDVRDGLKPVHRRILYAMKGLGLTSNASYKKCARIVGEVLGKYHPHGDTAVYDALVRLAQSFSVRYPLIDGQGNFGSVDGDSAAAMRYTEAKLSKITNELLVDLDKNTVDFRDNFDGSEQEPTVLPANLPNLLLMGGDGIAVGMATKIPPHNLSEVIDATIDLIDSAKIEKTKSKQKTEEEVAEAEPKDLLGDFDFESTIDDLLKHINGPDFPTGSTMYDWESIREAYVTGRGRIVQRAKAVIEEDKKGRFHIVITEIPYQVNKSRLVAKIADLVRKKKIDGISDLRDESDREGMRVVVDLKRDGRPKSVLNNLYKQTQLQDTFSANMVALNSDGTPQLMNLKTILSEYVKHRQLVITRRSQHELIAARHRAHILEGLLIALNNLDEVIETIRKSKDVDTARANLIKKFKLSEIQATAILDMQLRRLAALERQKIEDEYKAIKAKIDFLVDLLNNPVKVLATVAEELKEAKEKYQDERRTKLVKSKLGEFNEEDLIPSEENIVTITESGYIKRMPVNAYRSQRRGGKGVTGMKTKEEDPVAKILTANTHDNMLVFTNKGKVFKLRVYELPEGSRQAKGSNVINLINIAQDELIQSVITVSSKLDQIKDQYIALATKKGLVKKTAVSKFQNIRTSGIIAVQLNDGDELVWGNVTNGNSDIILITHFGKSIRFSENQVRPTSRDTKGVKGISLKKEDYVMAVRRLDPKPDKPADKRRKFFHDLLIITQKGYGKRTPFDQYPTQNRGGQGVKVANLTKKTGNVASALSANQDLDQILITTKEAQVIKLPLKNIPQLKRPTQGVILMRFSKKDDGVVAAAAIKKDNGEEELPE
ncbi:DNA gyrase subunit A [Patescibacteria group bacterium]